MRTWNHFVHLCSFILKGRTAKQEWMRRTLEEATSVKHRPNSLSISFTKIMWTINDLLKCIKTQITEMNIYSRNGWKFQGFELGIFRVGVQNFLLLFIRNWIKITSLQVSEFWRLLIGKIYTRIMINYHVKGLLMEAENSINGWNKVDIYYNRFIQFRLKFFALNID